MRTKKARPSEIILIANPRSTGNGLRRADELAQLLAKRHPTLPVRIERTQRAGHAEELAAGLYTANRRALIVSVSGDGGYHEVLNGVLSAKRPSDPPPFCAVYAAGNANDHHSAIKHTESIAEAIAANHHHRFDMIRVDLTFRGQTTARFVHSYGGFGLPAIVAAELNTTKRTTRAELRLAVRSWLSHRPVKLTEGNRSHRYDAWLFFNIERMAKYLKLADNTSYRDGQFEILALRHVGKLGLLWWGLRAATVGLGRLPQRRQATLTIGQATALQLDGEIIRVAAGTELSIKAVPQAIRTFA